MLATSQSLPTSATTPCSLHQISEAIGAGSPNLPPPRTGASGEAYCYLRDRVLCNVHWDKLRWLTCLGVKASRGWGACVWMFGAQHLHHPFHGFFAVLLRLQHASRLMLGYPPHHRPHITSDPLVCGKYYHCDPQTTPCGRR